MRQKNGFDQFPKFKSKGIKFEGGGKYLLWQLTASWSVRIVRLVHQNPLRDIILEISRETKSKIWRYEEVKEMIKSKIKD
jgi:hypothetical protein